MRLFGQGNRESPQEINPTPLEGGFLAVHRQSVSLLSLLPYQSIAHSEVIGSQALRDSFAGIRGAHATGSLVGSNHLRQSCIQDISWSPHEEGVKLTDPDTAAPLRILCLRLAVASKRLSLSTCSSRYPYRSLIGEPVSFRHQPISPY